MPLYDYVCTNCGHEIEVMHSVHGHGPSACGVCGGPMKKAIVAPAVHFKGSGWARKESSGGSSRSNRASSDSGSGSGSSSSSEDGPTATAAGTPSKSDTADSPAKDAD